MGKKEKFIDNYIAKSADFAKPILTHFRDLVHAVCPNVKEKLKWGFPHFDYKAGMMCSMAAFKQHCAISFWKASLMKDSDKLISTAKTEVAMGHLGRIASLKDLPTDKILKDYIRQAMELNDKGVKLPSKPKTSKAIEPPAYFISALKKNKKALKNFDAFSSGQKKEYVQWVTGAKTEETRLKRMKTTLEWLSEGKIKNWKYVK